MEGAAERDPKPEGEEEDKTPVLRNPATGKEYSIEEFERWVKKSFAAAGLTRFGTATHCFRIVGVTTLVAVGGVAAGGMGSWEGTAMTLCVHLALEHYIA